MSGRSTWFSVEAGSRLRACRRTVVVAVLVAAGACGDATGPKGPSPNDPAAGAFKMLSVNTQPLPFNIFNATGYRLDFAASTLALQTDGKYLMTQTTTETVAGFASTYLDTLSGTWTQVAGSLSLRAQDSTVTTATWDGRDIQLTMNSEGQTLRTVFRKAP
jgi:hypothetical protein